MTFTDKERSYLDSQLLGRLATIGPDGGPRNVPVGFHLNHDLGTIDIGGHSLGRSQKFRNVRRDARVSFVVDDLASVHPWTPRFMEIRGTAEALESGGEELGPGFAPELIRITPSRIVAFGIDEGRSARNVPSAS
ncbi:MAG TPA: PPOX class F420-dependent oxidoreductase [Streptosporangiaceae bacterium]|nr:PPOX class F420-dependent oxidoreductase [Streptosporangiaceae bacterium]